MSEAVRDQNHITVALGVSSVDHVTPKPFNIDPVTGRLLTDAAGGGGGYTNLTQFVAQTPWRVFYSDGAGAVTELALGANGTFLKSNGATNAPTFGTPAGAGTVTATGGALTANSVVLGAGTTDTKVVAGITTDGTSVLNLGVNTTTLGKLKLFGNTSGDVTLQPNAIAGTGIVLTLPATTGTLVTGGGTATGSNTGDQTSIVGITGTKAQFNTAVTDDDFAYLGTANGFSVGGQTITAADTTNVKGLTIYQNDTTNKPLGFQVGPDASKVSSSVLVQFNAQSGLFSDWAFNVAGSGVPAIDLQSTGGTLGTPTATAAPGTVSVINSYAYNSTPAQKKITSIEAYLDSGTASAESSTLYLSTIKAGIASCSTMFVGMGNSPIRI